MDGKISRIINQCNIVFIHEKFTINRTTFNNINKERGKKRFFISRSNEIDRGKLDESFEREWVYQC